MPFTFENFNYSGYLKMLGADDATANRELNDEERSSIYSDAVGRMFKEAAQESKNNPFLSTPKERYEYALEETLKMFPDARSAFNIPEERTTEEAFDPEEFRAFVTNHEVETEDIGFYLDEYAKTRINNYTKWQFPGLGNMTPKQFKDIFSERNDITEGMTRDDIIQGKFGKGYVDTSLPSSNAKTGYGAAAVHSLRQAKVLGWQTLQTIRDALPGENTESSAWLDRFVDEAKESVEKYNYQSRYPKSLGDTLAEDGFWAAVGKVFTSAVESWATSGASILTAVASAPLTGGTSVAAQVIGRGLQMISVMSSLQEIGGAREELERQGLYDPDNPIDAVIAGTISASLDHVAAFNAGFRVLAGKGKNVLTATTHGGTVAQGLERAGRQKYWADFAKRISAMGDTYGGRVLRAMGTEGWTEAAQELPAMWAASRKGADYSLSDYLNRTAEAGLVGALMGGGTHVLGTMSQSYADSRRGKREDVEGQRNRDVLNQRYNEEGMPHVVDQPDIAVREQHEKMFGADAQIFVTENGNTVVAVYGAEIVEVSYDKKQHGGKTDEEKFTFLRDKAQQELLNRVNANRVEINENDIVTTTTRTKDGDNIVTVSTSKITVDDPLQPNKKMTIVVEGGNSEAVLKELIRRHQSDKDPLVFRKGMRISKEEVGGEVTKESAAKYVVNENNIYRGKGRTRFTVGGNKVLRLATTVESEQDARLGKDAEKAIKDGGYEIIKMSEDRKKLTLRKDGLIFDVTIENVGGKKLGVGSGNYGIRAKVKITDPVTGNNTEYVQLLRQEAAKRDSETGYGDSVNEGFIDVAVPSSIIRLLDQPGGGKYFSDDDLRDFAGRIGGKLLEKEAVSEESLANVRRVAINYTDNNGEKKQKILSFYVFSGKKNSEGKSTTTVFVHDGKRFVTNPETVEDFAPLFEQGMENQVGEAVKKFGLSTASGAANTAKALGFTVYRWRSGQSSQNIKEEAYIFEREVDGKTVWIEVYSVGRVEDGAKRTTNVYYKVYTSDDDVAYFNRIAAIQKANTAEDIERVFGKQFFRTFVYRTSNGTYCTPKSGETTKLEEAYWTHDTDNVPATFEAVEVLMIHHKDCAKAVVATLASDEKEFVRLAKLYAKAVDMRDGDIEPPTLKLKKTKEQLDREREDKRKENEARKEAEKAQKEEDRKKQEKDEYQKKTEELVNQLRSDQQPALPKKTKTGWTNKSLLFRKERETDANGREHKYIVIRDRNGIEYNRGEYRNDGEMFEVVANMLNNQEEMTPRNFIIPDEGSRKVVDQIRRRTFVDLSDRVENGEGLSLLLVGGTKGDSSPLRLELRRKKDKKKGLSRENTEAIGEAYTVELEYTNDESLYNAYEKILDALNALDEDTISTLFVTPEDEATGGAVEAFNEAGVSVSEEEEQQQEQEIVVATTPEEQKAAFIKSMEADGSVTRDGRTFIVRKHTSKDAWVVEIREGDKEPDRVELGTREEALDTAYRIAVGEVVQGDGAPAPKKTRKKSKKAEQQQEQQQEQKPKKTTGRKKPTPTEDAIVSLNSVDAIKKRITNIVRKISSFDNAIKELASSGTAPQAVEHKKFNHNKEEFNKAIEEARESGDLTNLQDTVRRYTKEFFSRFTAYMQYVAKANGINATNGVKPGLSIRPNDTVDNVRERAANVIRDIDAKLTEQGEDMQSALQKIAKKSDTSFFAEISEKIRKNAKDIVVLSIDSGNDTVENAVRELSREMAIHNTVAEIVEAKLLSNNRLSELLANEALVVLHTQREARDLIERNTGVDTLYNKSGKIQGFVLKGKVYIVADSTQGKVTGVLLHELGVHFKKMGLRAPRYEALLADLQDRMAAAQAAESRGEQLTSEQVELLAAFERAKGAHLDVSDTRFWHEIAAYLVENNADYNEGIIGRIISYFKRFLYNWGLIDVKNISYRDMVMFARGSVRSARLANFNLTYSEIASENDFLNSIFESLNPSIVTDTDKDRDKERRKEEFKKEVEELKEKGRKEGYRAPNGKKSKLVRGTGPHYDERLWAIVRTTAFRNWFGDWLNASEEEKANMILDENGEPLLVFRGENTYEKEEGNVTQGEVRREFMPSRIILEDYSSDAGRHFSHDYDLAFGMINGSGNYPFLRQFTLRRGLVRNGDSNDLRATIYAGFISTKDARLVETEDFFGSSIYSALAKFKTEGILPLEVYNDILDTASEFDSTEIYDYYEERDEHILETFGEGSEELRQLREEFQQELQKNKAAWNKLHDYLREYHPNLILKYDNKGEAGDIRADYQGKEANWSFAIFDSSRFKDIDNNGLFSQEKDVFASVSNDTEISENPPTVSPSREFETVQFSMINDFEDDSFLHTLLKKYWNVNEEIPVPNEVSTEKRRLAIFDFFAERTRKERESLKDFVNLLSREDRDKWTNVIASLPNRNNEDFQKWGDFILSLNYKERKKWLNLGFGAKVSQIVNNAKSKEELDTVFGLLTPLWEAGFMSAKTDLSKTIRRQIAIGIRTNPETTRANIEVAGVEYKDDPKAYSDEEIKRIQTILENQIQYERNTVARKWRKGLNKLGNYTNAQKYFVWRSLTKYGRDNLSAIPVEYVEKYARRAFDLFSNYSDYANKDFYSIYTKIIVDDIFKNSEEVWESEDENGNVTGRWAKISRYQSDAIQRLRAASSGTTWCTRSMGADKVLKEDKHDFWVFVPNGSNNALVGFVPVHVGEDSQLETNRFYTGVFTSRDNDVNNVATPAILEYLDVLSNSQDQSTLYTLGLLGYGGFSEEERQKLLEDQYGDEFDFIGSFFKDHVRLETEEDFDQFETLFGVALYHNADGEVTIDSIEDREQYGDVPDIFVKDFYKLIANSVEVVNGDINFDVGEEVSFPLLRVAYGDVIIGWDGSRYGKLSAPNLRLIAGSLSVNKDSFVPRLSKVHNSFFVGPQSGGYILAGKKITDNVIILGDRKLDCVTIDGNLRIIDGDIDAPNLESVRGSMVVSSGNANFPNLISVDQQLNLQGKGTINVSNLFNVKDLFISDNIKANFEKLTFVDDLYSSSPYAKFPELLGVSNRFTVTIHQGARFSFPKLYEVRGEFTITGEGEIDLPNLKRVEKDSDRVRTPFDIKISRRVKLNSPYFERYNRRVRRGLEDDVLFSRQ